MHESSKHEQPLQNSFVRNINFNFSENQTPTHFLPTSQTRCFQKLATENHTFLRIHTSPPLSLISRTNRHNSPKASTRTDHRTINLNARVRRPTPHFSRHTANGSTRTHWSELARSVLIYMKQQIHPETNKTNKVIQIREQSGGMHRITQNHQRLHFGLGKNSRVDRITVKWPSGIVQRLDKVESNQILQITEPHQSTQ